MQTKQDGSQRATSRSHGKDFVEAARKSATRTDDRDAFIPDPGDGPPRVVDEFAEQIAEQYLASATSGKGDTTEDYEDAEDPEEIGGPFIITTAEQEIGYSRDSMNPDDAEVEPFPLVSRSPLGG
ncbi:MULTISPECIES: hypothetical protein [Sorangium]|uniref:Uncharacterized protein n=1 Tax=Sorangium cellulosum TaxID=56 RepID=A0A4P2QWZ3_SORCE|nr:MULTISPECIES: hypothetical protein [Sorangium]AUX35050.1 hypothetical protein SOCE836_072380 [Sorangium cellulosum]WCQ94355.1 hypothetical protein NQZ70_07120 [Sorangium sp. Soce836]